MKSLKFFTTLFGIFVFWQSFNPAFASESKDAALGAGSGFIGASLARAEDAFCRSVVNYSHVRGAFGEAVMDRVVLGSRRGGNWETVSLSPKPQGIDGIYIRRDKSGNPRSLLVGEAKFGSARLGMTKDGLQLGANWTNSRLHEEAARYRSAGRSADVEFAARPRRLGQKSDVVNASMSGGRKGYFWRNSLLDRWNYEGPQGSLSEARSVVLRDERYLTGAADGRISYRKRLFNIDVLKDTISVKVSGVRPSAGGGLAMKEIVRITVDPSMRQVLLGEARTQMAWDLMAKSPHLSEMEVRGVVRTATKGVSHVEGILRQQSRPYWRSASMDFARVGLGGGLFAGAITAGGQLLSRGYVDWGELSAVTVSGAASAGAGSLTQHAVVGAAIRNAAVNQFFVRTARVVGLPTGVAASQFAGGMAGGAIGSMVFATGMYLSGHMTAEEACRAGGSGVAGSAIGASASCALVAIAGTWGTASTGVAISSLSGAAANSAALACLGGGSVAAGGGGVFLGAAVATGVGVVVAIVATVVIEWGITAYDDNQTNKRMEMNSENLLKDMPLLRELSRRVWFPQSQGVN